MLRVMPLLATVGPVCCLIALHVAVRHGVVVLIVDSAVVVSWLLLIVCILLAAIRRSADVGCKMNVSWGKVLQDSEASLPEYFVVQPLRNETNAGVLKRSWESVENQSYPRRLIHLVLVVEQQDEPTLAAVDEALGEFRYSLRKIHLVKTAQTDGRWGKAASLNAACSYIRRHCNRAGSAPRRQVLVVDADSVLHPEDIACRESLTAGVDEECVLQSLLLNTLNYDSASSMSRIHTVAWLVYQLARMAYEVDYLVLGPGVSASLEVLASVGDFNPPRHNEDMLFRYKAVLEGIPVRPLCIPTWQMSPWKWQESWSQLARWARGALDIEFVSTYQTRRSKRGLRLFLARVWLAMHILRSHSMPSLLVLTPLVTLPGSLFYNGLRLGISGFLGWLGLVLIHTFPILLCTLMTRLAVPRIVSAIGPHTSRVTRSRVARDSMLVLHLPEIVAMAAAALYTQLRVAVGIDVSKTLTTRK